MSGLADHAFVHGPEAASVRTSARLPTTVPIVMYLDTAEPGGAAVHALDLASGFTRRGYTVAALCHRAEDLAAMRSQLREAGVEVHSAEDWDLSLKGRLRRMLSLTSAIRRYPDCVLVLMIGNYRSGGPATMAGVLGRARVIVRADMQPPMPPVHRRHKISIVLKDLFIDRVVVNAAQSRQSFMRDMGRAGRKIEVVHQGIELHRFTPGVGRDAARAELGYAHDDVLVGVVSRLGGDAWRKGIDRFLEAVGFLAPRSPHARFIVIGDGGMRPTLERQAEALGVADRVRWTGWRADVPRLLAAMDVFVMPSLYEGTPTILMEAMAMAKAVVATRVGAVPEVLVDGDNGISVAANDGRALADAIEPLLSDAVLRARLGSQARETAERRLSREVMIDGYLAVFGRVYQRRQGSSRLRARRSTESPPSGDRQPTPRQ